MHLIGPHVIGARIPCDLDRLLARQDFCLSEIERATRRSFSVPQEGKETCAYLKGLNAALLLLNKRIDLAVKQDIEQEKFKQIAQKVVSTTVGWYEHQKTTQLVCLQPKVLGRQLERRA